MNELSPYQLAVNKRFMEAFDMLGYPKIRSGISVFCNEIDLHTSTFSKIEKNERSVPKHYLAKMEKQLGISENWLRTGDLPIRVDIEKKKVESIKDISIPFSEDFTELPYISVPARASFLDMFQDERSYGVFETYRVYQLDPSLQKKGAIVIEVNGDSMEPQLKDRAKVLAIPVPSGDWCYQSGGVYALAYANQFVIKRIGNNDQIAKTLTLTSDNQNGGRLTIPISEVRGMWKILEVVQSKVE